MIVGITGHSSFDEPTTGAVREALSEHMAEFDPAGLVGVTCLARGADQIFADVILDAGGALEVVSPAADYFDRIPDGDERARCDHYLSQASAVRTLPFEHAGHRAYLAASEVMVDRIDRLFAVWDGGTSSGTHDAVSYARAEGCDVVVVWPAGARRV